MSSYTSKTRVHEKYKVVGFISSGTYGRVYKAVNRNGTPGEFAIKKSDPQWSDLSAADIWTDSSQTRKGKLYSTPASPSQLVVKWPYVQSFHILISSILSRLS